MKKIFLLLIFFAKPLIFIFFDKKYLNGRQFERGQVEGWLWVLKGLWFQKVLGFNRSLPFPASPTIRISNYKNLVFGRNVMQNMQSPGCYFQCFSARIFLGDNCYIAQNVGIITANHDPLDVNRHLPGKDVVIGEGSWIGMGAIILPGVILGKNSIVGAGAVVTKSYPEGNVVLAGNPARIIRVLGEVDDK